ncbi:MAG TPA: M1 family metallopeptidase, partial [Gemmatimonadales bacterium]
RDFYVHQYLNAFRPGSRWAAADSAEGRVRYQHMQDPDYAYERISAATVMGQAAAPDYPGAPDSTIAHWTLPRPLAPGDSMVVEIDWTARPSTLPRRQGRDPATRRYDFAQWYPKVVVFDRHGWEAHPLYPGGEFYGEFGTFDVTLDLPADQVIGATGVPVCGDPGWSAARADPNEAVDYQRDWYPGAPHDCAEAAPGRKTVRFYARDVHHFAFSLNPRYVYAQGHYGPVAVHVLYQPQDSATWGKGIAVRNSVIALGWLDSLYGKYQWPQFTNVHRIEGGGTEFPMMIMDGGASLGLILHEGGHQYTMGQLANNEWKEGFLDEGFTSFQTGWFFETHGGRPSFPGLDNFITQLDVDGWSQPVSMVSERYRDFTTYNLMIYTKAQLFYEELRYVVGDDVMRRILRTYFERWKLKHVDEDAFRAVCEEVSGQDLGWLFGQWLHGVPRIDYRLAKVERRRGTDGKWHVAVTIDRLGDGWMPVEIGDATTIYARATGQPARERVEFTSDTRPGRLMLDPRLRTHDWNYLNNRERRVFSGRELWELRLDDPTTTVARRDRGVTALLPVVWSNTAGGLTVALRDRANYLGQFDRSLSLVSVATRGGAAQPAGFYFRVTNPVALQRPRTETTLGAWDVEGRAGASIHVDHSLKTHLDQPSDPHAGMDAIWMATTGITYVDRRLWTDAGTIEVGPWFSTEAPLGRGTVRVKSSARGGLVYQQPGTGSISPTRYDVEPYARVTAEGSGRWPFWLGTDIGFRVFGGAYLGSSSPVKQRRIYVGGADPYATFADPLVRSRGALLVGPDFFYQIPGDANMRAFAPSRGGRWAISVNGELTRDLFRRHAGVMRRVALEGFGDVAVVDTAAVPTRGRWWTPLYDGGVGLVTEQAVGALGWTMRFEVPIVVNRWNYASDFPAGHTRFAFRWQVSLSPSF